MGGQDEWVFRIYRWLKWIEVSFDNFGHVLNLLGAILELGEGQKEFFMIQFENLPSGVDMHFLVEIP